MRGHKLSYGRARPTWFGSCTCGKWTSAARATQKDVWHDWRKHITEALRA